MKKKTIKFRRATRKEVQSDLASIGKCEICLSTAKERREGLREGWSCKACGGVKSAKRVVKC